MRQFRKIQYIILAIVPLVALLAFVLSNVGNTQGVEYLPTGGFDIVDNVIVCEPNTWCDRICSPLIGETGIWTAFAKLLATLNTTVGLPYSFPVLIGLCYALWGVYITLMQLLVDFITFVPRKCMDFLGGKTA